MTAKKSTQEYVLIDSYDDPIMIGDANDVKEYIETARQFEENPENHSFTLRRVGAEVSVTVEQTLTIEIGA